MTNRCKVFDSFSLMDDAPIEEQINNYIDKNDVKLISASISKSDRTLVAIIVYEENTNA